MNFKLQNNLIKGCVPPGTKIPKIVVYSNEVYLRKCKQVNILPLYRFMFNDMNIFHKVVYKIIPVTMPDYLSLYSGDSRLRSTDLDNLSFVSNIASTTTSIINLNNFFFVATRYGTFYYLIQEIQ